jgi:polyhydroxybutyrate depolymerase
MHKRLLIFLVTAGFMCDCQAQKNIDATLYVSNTKREYIIHLPPGYKKEEPLPMVMVFHGGGGNSRQIQRYMGMDAIADCENFIAVYPNGIGKQWNDGRDFKASVSANDDAQFVSQLLDSMQKNYAIDKKRVFATGISNGGFFSIYLSYKLGHRLLAVAPVCASIPEKIYPFFYPAQPINVMIMNGTGDPLVPYNGGAVGNSRMGDRGRCTATDSTLQRYMSINKTSPTPLIEEIPDRNKRDGCIATSYTYTGGRNDTRVCLVKIKNGGHTLPGGSPYLPKAIIGRVCNDFEGNEMIWEFFKSCKPAN